MRIHDVHEALVQGRVAIASTFVALVALSACSVRGAGPGDLFTPLKNEPANESPSINDSADASVLKRIDVTCSAPPAPPASQMVDVPAGDFEMGCNSAVDSQCNPDELPQHTVTLSDFQIDVTEVTAAQYYECVAAKACLAPTCDYAPCDVATANLPAVCVIHADAEAYCAWQNKRLPTEAEWEKAARGTTGLKYPWGNDSLDCQHANFAGCAGASVAVGSYPMGASPYGALDMAGNVVEYVSDRYDENYYAVSPSADPQGPATGTDFGGRGGGFRSDGVWQRTSERDTYATVYVRDSLGFRCAKSGAAND